MLTEAGHVFDRWRAPYIIAEIGVNHDGDLGRARRSIESAAAAGVDAVKFQTFRADEFMADRDHTYEYKAGDTIVHESMYGMFKRLELPSNWHGPLRDYACESGVDFLSSAADPQSVDLLVKLGVAAIKLASEDLINLPLLEYVAGTGWPVLLSTGMADEGEVDRAVRVLRGRVPELLLLHCVSLYPTPDAEVNLCRMTALAKRTGLQIGYSDHSHGIEAAVGAVALGARVIEKHFTIDRSLPGPDHALSADPREMADLVRACRRVAAMRGEPKVEPSAGEYQARRDFRRSIVAAADLAADTVLTSAHLSLKRPGTGIHPFRVEELLGRRLSIPLARDEQVTLEHLAPEPEARRR
jgi:sialic acid synthase SpsE